ncbi:MAG: hypothetical protein HC825_03310 [Oscillatoriales cyanobacterium RM1_1_9]|nr:hypothetical protein [Oscillatoriales cyanobacterium SM2_3_0]NJO46769.1 hypothetical protein [Oscillatoriales cyanobacterium RM2_1_1]NJO70985.1 hypothetical protein [Oscillatoriales cyanobacterium RM1_1_9]
MSSGDSSASQAANKVEFSVQIDSELLDQVQHLTNDPSKVFEAALRQWLRGDRPEDELALTLRRNPPIPPRGEWND